jgi:hypothetical protein
MMEKIRNTKRPKKSVVELAIAALDPAKNPLDEDMSAVDPAPTSLDLPEKAHRKLCSRCMRPAVGRCRECGSPLCGDCELA